MTHKVAERIHNKILCVWHILIGNGVMYRCVIGGKGDITIGPKLPDTNHLYVTDSKIFPVVEKVVR